MVQNCILHGHGENIEENLSTVPGLLKQKLFLKTPFVPSFQRQYPFDCSG